MAKLKELGADEDSIHATPAAVGRDEIPVCTPSYVPAGAPNYTPAPAYYPPNSYSPAPAPSTSMYSIWSMLYYPPNSYSPAPAYTLPSPGPADSTTSSSDENETTPRHGHPAPYRPATNGEPQAVLPYVPGTSSGSAGEPGSGPLQPTPPIPYPASFVARTTLTAEWPINAGKPDDTALNVEKLREKLIAAKLCGALPPPAVVYMQASQASGFGPNGGLQLMSIRTLSKSERKSALAAAMANAKEQAAELAEAAGCHLGPLTSVSGDLAPFNWGRMIGPIGNDSPSSLEVTISVTLHFQIAP